MKKVIILDFWGTLVETGVPQHIKQIQRFLGLLRLPYSEFVQRFERAMMTRPFPQLRDAFIAVCEEFSVPPDEALLGKCVGLWNTSWLLAKPYPETMSVLQALKEKHKLVLLSNTDCFSVNQVLEKFGLRNSFDLLVLSYESGAMKTDPVCYQTILTHFGAAPEDCLAVGDSIYSDIAAAEQAQVEAILIDRRDTRDFPHKIKDLKELLTWN